MKTRAERITKDGMHSWQDADTREYLRGRETMRKTYKYSDLHDHILHPEFKGEVLFCPSCGNEFSANKGDYFGINPNDKLIHEECETPFRIVRKVTKFEEARDDWRSQ